MIKFLHPRSLRYQLLGRSLLLLAALLLLIGFLQYVFMKDFLYKNKAEALYTQLMAMPPDLFSNAANGSGEIRPRPAPPESPVFYQPGFALTLIDQNGAATNLSPDDDISAPLLPAEQYEQIESDLLQHKRVQYEIAANAAGEKQLVVFRLAGRPGASEGLIQASIETESLHKLLLTQVSVFAMLALAALAGGLALYMPLLNRTLAPLSRIVEAAEHTDAGNLDSRLPERQGQQEIDRLSEAFNGMLERLDASFETERQTTARMRQFIADASHELRTPLTSIHGFLEVLLRGAALNGEQLKSALTSMQLESARINKLVEDLLQLAKLDQAPDIELADCSLNDMLQELEPQLRILAGKRHMLLEMTEPINVQAHPDKLKQVILNLFLNAVQHTDEALGRIAIELSRQHRTAVIAIRDNGAGINEEHLPFLFERFYRSESSRSRTKGGAGLGLAISKSIVVAHHGTIEVAGTEGDGAAFIIKLPLNE